MLHRLWQADPLSREETDSTSSDQEEHETLTNLVALPVEEGQEQSVHAFCRHKREDPGMEGSDGEEGGKKDPRSVTVGDQDFLMTEEQPEDLHVESEAREAPCASPGHA
ncbi:hypothetical protein NDU88_005537 [Pleurodeles waltl]|uniref:Uncharacterized protein n=1 Tax=Pleurodeles waltl TaxID=8319 RepID=A0AAV7X0Y2_PLEWA|nr:hypothetical protein NDU88_005537 [Pleurodeles waltl]